MLALKLSIFGARSRAALRRRALKLATCVWLIGLIGLISLMWCTFASALSRDVPLGELRHTAWGAKEGAPAGGARALVQANDGFLWMAGFNGLFRFDGLAFERVELPRSDRLASMAVFSLYAPQSGGIWLGFTFGGAGLLKDGQLTVYTEKDGLPAGSVYSFIEDLDHTLWAATNKGLARLEGSRWRVVGTDWGLPPAATQSLIVDSQGTLWVTVPGRAFFLPRSDSAFQEIKVPLSDFVSIAESPTGEVWASDDLGLRRIRKNNNITGRAAQSNLGIMFDRNGGLWGTSITRELYRVTDLQRHAEGAVILWRNIPKASAEVKGMSSNTVNPIHVEDREGNMWIGTTRGLDRFSERNLTRVIPSTAVAKKAEMVEVGLAPAAQGALWIVGAGAVVSFYNGKFTTYDKLRDIFCVHRADDGSTWFGGPVGLWRHVEGKGKGRFEQVPRPIGTEGRDVQALAVDRSGAVWVSIARQGVFAQVDAGWVRRDMLPAEPRAVALTMHKDADGHLWFGFTDNRIAVLNGGKLQTFTATEGVNVGNVTALSGRSTRLWAGGEFGLSFLSGTRFKPILAQVAQHFLGVSGIVETTDGDLWLIGAAGIVHVRAAELQRGIDDASYRVSTEAFGALDGLQGTGARPVRPLPSAIEGTDGKLWFATNSDIYSVDPARIFRNPLPPPVLIRRFSADGASYMPVNGQLSLPERTHAVRIDYVALSLTLAEKVRYRYRLTGIDKDWQEADARREAFYTNLAPGNYRFDVVAANNDGVWNMTGATLDFTIPPAFVETRTFVALCALAALTIVLMLVQLRIRQMAARMRVRQQERLDERERIARELHDTLLQSTQGLILRFQAVANGIPCSEPARESLEKALERADEVMAEGRDRVMDLRIPAHMWGDLQQAFATAGKDLAIDSRSTFHIAADGVARALNANVREEIYAIGREALLNAFRHADAALIEIDIVYAKQEFRLYVRDNGAGIEETILEAGGRSGHWGLKGMRERAAAIGATLNVERRCEGGTQIEVSLAGSIAYKKRGMFLTLSMRSIRKFFGSAK
jgi:signal transduction histidine kinase/ligand-binding sensor domain-containing protein